MTMTDPQTQSDRIFKTRSKPCQWKVRADIQRLRHSKEKRLHFSAINTSLSADLSRIQSPGPMTLLFTDDWQLKTDDSQRSCSLLFPNGTRRSSTTGLLEQMP